MRASALKDNLKGLQSNLNVEIDQAAIKEKATEVAGQVCVLRAALRAMRLACAKIKPTSHNNNQQQQT